MKVKCELCPTECVLGDYEVGGCKVRMNKGGALYSLVYAKPCAVAIDPIEKKPFYHFLPGTKAFSIATAGCVLSCKFCQNWQISQARPEDVEHHDLPPDEVVRRAMFYGAKSVTYTYTEPTVFYEYMFDTAVIAKKFGVKNTMHTCGYINEKPLLALLPYMDAADVDLKAFDEGFYSKICGGRLRPVLDTLIRLKKAGVWVEITNLIIPTLNDDMKKINDMCRWIAETLGPDVPIHFSRFYPYYKLLNLPPTPEAVLMEAKATAHFAGLRYAYVGNIRTPAENTYCPKCKKLIVERVGYDVKSVNINAGRCAFCGLPIAGVWS